MCGAKQNVCAMYHLNDHVLVGSVPLASHCKEELSNRGVPQLAARLQRVTVHVCDDHSKWK